jgi:hypothetical protein
MKEQKEKENLFNRYIHCVQSTGIGEKKIMKGNRGN